MHELDAKGSIGGEGRRSSVMELPECPQIKGLGVYGAWF